MIEPFQSEKSYQIGGETIDVLREIDMKIEPGEYLSIMGPSGSGKSTIMNIIGCLDRPTSGIYRLDGEDISSYGEREPCRCQKPFNRFCFSAVSASAALECHKKCGAFR